MDTESLSERSRVLRALADDTRREIVLLLCSGGQPVGRLAENFAMSRPAVSKHLRLMRQAGLVSETRQGRQRIYELDRARVDEAAAWLAELTAGRPSAGTGTPSPATQSSPARTPRKPGAAKKRRKPPDPRQPSSAPGSDWRCW